MKTTSAAHLCLAGLMAAAFGVRQQRSDGAGVSFGVRDTRGSRVPSPSTSALKNSRGRTTSILTCRPGT